MLLIEKYFLNWIRWKEQKPEQKRKSILINVVSTQKHMWMEVLDVLVLFIIYFVNYSPKPSKKDDSPYFLAIIPPHIIKWNIPYFDRTPEKDSLSKLICDAKDILGHSASSRSKVSNQHEKHQ